MTESSKETDYIPIVVSYQNTANQLNQTPQIADQNVMWWSPPDSRPQLHEVDTTPFFDPYLFVPRLFELREWVTRPSKALKYFLLWKENTVRNLTKQLITLVVGEGFNVRILSSEVKENGEREEEEEISKGVNSWLNRIGGKGRSVNNYLIPWVILDNVSTGGCSFYKYIAEEGDDDDELGELYCKHLDPRTYVVVHHDFRDWRKLVQFPIVQNGITEDMSRDQFENWKPSLNWSMIWHFSSPGLTKQLPPRDIPWNKQYYFDLFFKAPMDTVVEDIISKMQAKLYHIKGLEKYAFPFIVIKVPRHAIRDVDDAKFQQKLKDAAQIAAEMRTGDSFAFEGREYDADGRTLSEGWEIVPIETARQMKEFQPDVRMLDEQIAIGLFMNIAMISSSGTMGQQTHMATGANLNSNIQMLGKDLRAEIQIGLFEIIKDYVLLKYNVKLEDDQIEEQWSKIREADIASFFQVIFQSYTGQLITFEEARALMSRISIDLPEISQEDVFDPFAEEEGDEGGFDQSKLPPLPAEEPQDKEEKKG